MKTTVPDKKSSRSAKVAGWIAVTFGVVHVVVAPFTVREVWSQVLAEGWWNTFTLDKAMTLAELQRSEALWVSLGSFGIPVLVIGCHIVWSAHRRHRIPGWIGWIVLAWSLLLVTAVPVSPAWALTAVGVLIIAGDSRRNRDPRQAAAPAALAENR